MENANLVRTLSRTFYSLTRRYGVPGSIHKRTETETDYASGTISQATTHVNVRNLAEVPMKMQREVIYTATQMQTARPFAWQGAMGFDTQHTMFMIMVRDLNGWGQIEASQWIVSKRKRYEIVDAVETPGGWIITAKRVEGTDNAIYIDVQDGAALEDSCEYTLGP